MGHQRISMEVDVYSCSCGWIGTEPATKRVDTLNDGEMGRLALGKRSGRAYLRYDCPLCQKSIEASPPVELMRVTSIDELCSGNGGTRRNMPPAGSQPTRAVSSPALDAGE